MSNMPGGNVEEFFEYCPSLQSIHVEFEGNEFIRPVNQSEENRLPDWFDNDLYFLAILFALVAIITFFPSLDFLKLTRR